MYTHTCMRIDIAPAAAGATVSERQGAGKSPSTIGVNPVTRRASFPAPPLPRSPHARYAPRPGGAGVVAGVINLSRLLLHPPNEVF